MVSNIFLCSPPFGEMIQFDYCNIFQMGWNHQLELEGFGFYMVLLFWFQTFEAKPSSTSDVCSPINEGNYPKATHDVNYRDMPRGKTALLLRCQSQVIKGCLQSCFFWIPRKATIMECLALGVVPIINENDSTNTEELRFGDNVGCLGSRVLELLSLEKNSKRYV